MANEPTTAYPVSVDGEIDPNLGRWLWLIKLLLIIPHVVVLIFLWIAYVHLTIYVLFVILFTGKYPRGIFDFNVGVLRWTWRVAFYSYSALATDRYPPFSLSTRDYPANLEVEYPERLSQGLVLVKWWLLAIPHYLVVSFLRGGSRSVGWSHGPAGHLRRRGTALQQAVSCRYIPAGYRLQPLDAEGCRLRLIDD